MEKYWRYIFTAFTAYTAPNFRTRSQVGAKSTLTVKRLTQIRGVPDVAAPATTDEH
jgi:hypothetical protein